MKEYQDGIVLYKAEQAEVWNKISVTDSVLKKYFSENKSKFEFPERVDISELHIDTDTLAAMVYDSLMHGVDFGDLATRYNDDADLKTKKGVRGPMSVDTDELTQAASKLKPGDYTEPFDDGSGKFAIVRLNGREPAREKSFEEAGAEVSNAYQEFESKRLEQDWLDRIKKNHPVKQHRESLRDAFSSPPIHQ